MALCDRPLLLTSMACRVGGQKHNQIGSIEHSNQQSLESCSSLFEHKKIRFIIWFNTGNTEQTLQLDLPTVTVTCLFITSQRKRNAIFTALPKSIIEEIVMLLET